MVIKWEKSNSYMMLGLFIVSLFKAMGMNSSDTLYVMAMLFALGCACIQIVLTARTYTKNQMLGLIVFLALTLINLMIIKDITLLITFFFFVAVRKLALRQALKMILVAKVIGFLTNIALVLMGLKTANVVLFYRNGFILRSDFGFGHANTFHFIYASIIVLVFLLYYSKLKWWHMLLVYLSNDYIYQLSLSRTGYYNVLLLLGLFLLLKYQVIKSLLYTFGQYAQIFFSILTYLLATVFYNTVLVQVLNQLLTGRIAYSHYQYLRGFSLFGHSFQSTGILFDNSYSMIATQYGMGLTVLFLVLYGLTLKQLVTRRLDTLILLMSVMSLYLFTESYLPSAIVNLSWLVMSKVYFGEIDSLEQEFR